MALNKAMLIGNVGRDPEIRYAGGQGNPGETAPKVASFTLATSERYRDRNGNQHENTEWHNIVAWRGLADLVEKYVKKGTQLYVEGSLRTRSWIDQTGSKRFTTEIQAENIQLLSRRNDNSSDGSQAYQPRYNNQQDSSYVPQQPSQPASAPQSAPAASPSQAPADDLPF